MGPLRVVLPPLIFAGFVACASQEEAPAAFAAPARDAGPPPTEDGVETPIGACQPGECCIEGSLPEQGVRLLVKATSCNVARGHSVHFDIGIEITRDITVDEHAKLKVPGKPGALAASLASSAEEGASQSTTVELEGSGARDHYCNCNNANSPDPDSTPFQHVVKPTSHLYPFTWDTRRYEGETDYGGGEGDPFELGPASIIVTFLINDDVQLPVTLPFTIVAAP